MRHSPRQQFWIAMLFMVLVAGALFGSLWLYKVW